MTAGFAIGLLALLLPMAAMAQDLRYSDAETLICLDQAQDPEDCIGASAKACMEATDDGSTTVGMGYCLDAELTFWDRRLNAAYKALAEDHKAADAEMAGMDASAPPMAPALRDMQRAWIAFRDAACAYERSLWGGGTGGGPAWTGCMMTQTGRQALRLEAGLSGG